MGFWGGVTVSVARLVLGWLSLSGDSSHTSVYSTRCFGYIYSVVVVVDPVKSVYLPIPFYHHGSLT